METLVPRSLCQHTTIRITTRCPTEFIDLTGDVETLVARADLRAGFVNIQSLHTTAAIVLNEDEPLLLGDFAAFLERAAPEQAGYQHDDPAVRRVNVTMDERINGHAHCRALLLGPSVCLNVVDGRLRLGRWQRLFLAELDGPRDRDISIVLLGDGGR